MIINISQDQQIILHEDPIKCIEIKKSSTQVFNEVDHSANSARIAFEQNKFSKNVRSHLESNGSFSFQTGNITRNRLAVHNDIKIQ